MKQSKGVPPAIILCNPKYGHNVGGVLRMASCFNVRQLWWTGHRVTMNVPRGERLPREERMKDYASVEVYPEQDRPFDAFDTDVTPVGVELIKGAQLLPHFEHPKNPVYVFGPEDGSIPGGMRAFCHQFVAIPTAHCLNLANAVGLVLYDRLLKQMQQGVVGGWTMDDFLREQRGWYDPGDARSSGIEGLSGDEVAEFDTR